MNNGMLPIFSVAFFFHGKSLFISRRKTAATVSGFFILILAAQRAKFLLSHSEIN